MLGRMASDPITSRSCRRPIWEKEIIKSALSSSFPGKSVLDHPRVWIELGRVDPAVYNYINIHYFILPRFYSAVDGKFVHRELEEIANITFLTFCRYILCFELVPVILFIFEQEMLITYSQLHNFFSSQTQFTFVMFIYSLLGGLVKVHGKITILLLSLFSDSCDTSCNKR